MGKYQQFLEKKKHSANNYGIEPTWIPDTMFDYQKYLTEYVIRKGRAGGFIDTGLGKTLIELTTAYNYVMNTNKPTLIITPLAVAFQFVAEAEKFGIPDVEYSKQGKFTGKIIICNYERLSYFDANDFGCVILDESSILKNFNGSIKDHITVFLKKVRYRFLFTATPSPNDFVELGTSSEALGYMGYMDMLGKFFANNENNIRPQDIGTKWYLKPHAKDAFFKWVSSWSISMKTPSDHGFDDSDYKLPELVINHHSVKNENNWVVDGQIMLFNQLAQRLGEVREEQKNTIEKRVYKAIECTKDHDISVYWCNFNDEGDLIERLDDDAVQISGSMTLERKEDILYAFSKGEIKRLITKPKITAFGLNWQHCNHAVYFPTFSYEQYYQAIRRFWRFGQKRDVICDMIYSDGQKRVIDTLLLKTEKAKELYTNLNSHVNQKVDFKKQLFDKQIQLPNFI